MEGKKYNNTQTILVSLWGTRIGILSWNTRTRVSVFWFTPEYFALPYDIAPIAYPKSLQSAAIGIQGIRKPKEYQGLPPFIADSLPDRWGNALFDRWFAINALHEIDKTPLTKLSFIARRAIGALEFTPIIESGFYDSQKVHIDELYKEALNVEKELAGASIPAGEPLTRKALMAIGTSAGGRQMKAIVSIAPDGTIYSGQTTADPSFEHCILKFNTPEYALSEIEMTYYEMAIAAGICMMPSRLIEVEGVCHFLTRRFDRKDGKKVFVQTLSAIDPDAHSYEDLFRTARELGVPKPEMEELFRCAVFNVLANNTDDHEKNFSFLMNQDGQWHVSPAYDITFIIASNGIEAETVHCISLNGKLSDITEEDLLKLGRDLSIKNPAEIIREVRNGIAIFPEAALRNGVDAFHIEIISRRLHHLNPELQFPESCFESPSFTTEDGIRISGIHFEKSVSGNIHICATVDGQDKKYVVTPKRALFSEILKEGFNGMAAKKKIEYARKYLL